VIFDKALREVGGERNPDQFSLEYHDVALADLSRMNTAAPPPRRP
jgi:hypothetical protein